MDQASIVCGYSAARPWNDSTFGFSITPSRISMHRRIVSSASHAAGPPITVSRNVTTTRDSSHDALRQCQLGEWFTA
jgi:hypothetical protein